MNDTRTLPHSEQAELVVLGALLSDPSLAPEVVGAAVLPQHFFFAAHRVIFEAITEAHYADDPLDPITIGEQSKKKLSKLWGIEEGQAVERVFAISASQLAQSDPMANAQTIKRNFDLRELVKLGALIQSSIERGEDSPEAIASDVSTKAMQIATDRLLTHDILSYADLGRRWLDDARRVVAAKEQGIELGVYFGVPWIDDFTRGIQPTELMFAAGEPGVGKSAVWWNATERFARRQQRTHQQRLEQGATDDRRIASLILSLEMGEQPSSNRLAQSVSGIDGGKIREGSVTKDELFRAAQKWAAQKEIPLYFNHTSAMRASQMKALIVDAIRRFNVGLVVIDHFRYFDMDRRPDNANEHDDEKVRFLKQGLAKELNIAVICLAHTAKSIERQDKRPRMGDLRGSGMIAAEADFINFVYRPWKYATEKDKDAGRVHRTEAELIWAKNRHGGESTATFYFNPATMQIS